MNGGVWLENAGIWLMEGLIEKEDLSGRTIGNFEVIKRAQYRSRRGLVRGNRWWTCRCKVCGECLDIAEKNIGAGWKCCYKRSCQPRDFGKEAMIKRRRDRAREKSRRRTETASRSMKSRKEFVKEIKRMHGCMNPLCKWGRVTRPRMLEFHHKDRSAKDGLINVVMGGGIDVLIAEINKCMVLCSNCHRMVHDGYFSDMLIPEVHVTREDFDLSYLNAENSKVSCCR